MPTHSKYVIVAGNWYGNMQALEYVSIITKEGHTEWRWKCKDEDGNIYHMRTRALYAKGLKDKEHEEKTVEELNQYLENLEKEKKNQMGLRKKYYQEYISNAIKRSIPFNLTFDEFNNLISQSCHYCGQDPYIHESMLKRANMSEPILKCVGIDRIDSKKFYNLDNCVPCCSKCNIMKMALGSDDFLRHVEKIHNHQKFLKERSSTIPEGSTSEVCADGSGTPQINLGEDIVTS